jgi:23S rRNA (uracil1939-C5)-methyltransferase
MRKFRNKVIENVLLLDIAAEGKCVARVDEKVYFVEGGVPGDLVDILVEKDKKSFAQARVYKLKTPSADREPAFCSHFGVCGGCKWQNLNYNRQLELKAKQVKDAFERIGKIKEGNWFPILPSEKTTYYRNKLEYTFSDKRWLENTDADVENRGSLNALGFHIPRRFDKILDIQHCYLQPDPSNAIRLWTKAYAETQGLSFFNLKDQFGLLRNLMIRTASTGALMVLVIFAEDKPEEIKSMLTAMHAAFPEITSLQFIINRKMNDAYQDLKAESFAGEPFVLEQMEDLQFRVGPTSFYQTNGQQALELYRLVDQLAQAGKEDLVYDLYTGTGTIAQFIARKAKHVVGVEYVEASVQDAKENAILNKLTNTSFFAGDMGKVLNAKFVAENGRPKILITDPPRAGMHPDVIQQILDIAPERIVYVSCNPATQARDLAAMTDYYEVLEIHPVDMFPHTHHVENVVLMEKRKPETPNPHSD